MTTDRDRRADGRAENARPRDDAGRPLPRGVQGSAKEPDPEAQEPAKALLLVQQLIDDDRPFRAHEVCEAQWKAVDRGDAGERAFWQGLAQVCVGLTHLARGNSAGALALLHRGAARLLESGDRHGVQALALAQQAERVAQGAPERLVVVPEARP